MDETLALIALSRLHGLNRIEKRRLAEDQANVSSLFTDKLSVKGNLLREKIASFKDWKQIETDITKIKALGGHIITIHDTKYPSLLRSLPDAPVVLYARGPFEPGADTLGIVGSRKATYEGINLAQKIAQTVSSVGISVVSGFARGIDSAAHRGGLKERGKTIGVLGCGIDICYPPENRQLFNTIAEEGLLITEYGPGEKPLRFHFPERNRIIAGLSRGILVVEASQKSGSLITARLGLEYGREVMAVPGSVFRDEYKGANALIKQGARLIEDINDILTSAFPDHRLRPMKRVEITQDEENIFSRIGAEKIHVDELIQDTGMHAKEVMAILTQLEMKEAIREVPGGFYIRS